MLLVEKYFPVLIEFFPGVEAHKVFKLSVKRFMVWMIVTVQYKKNGEPYKCVRWIKAENDEDLAVKVLEFFKDIRNEYNGRD